MAQLVSAKKLLLKYDPTTPTDSEGKKYRGTAHEFQDYAYRLASDLNDREHLHIYMKLAKTYPRYLLEEVYQFIADIDEYNKGKLFMWKFKQIREEYRLQKELKNFSYDLIIKKSKDLNNKLASQIIRKESNLDNNILAKFIARISFENLTNKSKILFISPHSTLVPTSILGFGCKVFGIGFSNQIIKKIKEDLKHIKGTKFISKEFFKNTYKENEFDLVVVDKFWKFLPLEKEKVFIQELKRILKKDSEVIVQFKFSDESDQKWNKIIVGNETEYYFDKENNPEVVKELFKSQGFGVINEFNTENVYVLRLRIN